MQTVIFLRLHVSELQFFVSLRFIYRYRSKDGDIFVARQDDIVHGEGDRASLGPNIDGELALAG